MSEVSFVCSPRGKPFLLWLCNYERWGQWLQEYPDSVIAHDVALNQTMFYCFQWNAQTPNVPGFFQEGPFWRLVPNPKETHSSGTQRRKSRDVGSFRELELFLTLFVTVHVSYNIFRLLNNIWYLNYITAMYINLHDTWTSLNSGPSCRVYANLSSAIPGHFRSFTWHLFPRWWRHWAPATHPQESPNYHRLSSCWGYSGILYDTRMTLIEITYGYEFLLRLLNIAESTFV